MPNLALKPEVTFCVRHHCTLGRTLFGYPFPVLFQDTLAEKRLDRRRDTAIGYPAGHKGDQAVLWDRSRASSAFDTGSHGVRTFASVSGRAYNVMT
jgi:hypothetical protein